MIMRDCSSSVQASVSIAAVIESSATKAPKRLRAASSDAIRTRIAATAKPASSATRMLEAAVRLTVTAPPRKATKVMAPPSSCAAKPAAAESARKRQKPVPT